MFQVETAQGVRASHSRHHIQLSRMDVLALTCAKARKYAHLSVALDLFQDLRLLLR